jgi:hypothetical protein
VAAGASSSASVAADRQRWEGWLRQGA